MSNWENQTDKTRQALLSIYLSYTGLNFVLHCIRVTQNDLSNTHSFTDNTLLKGQKIRGTIRLLSLSDCCRGLQDLLKLSANE